MTASYHHKAGKITESWQDFTGETAVLENHWEPSTFRSKELQSTQKDKVDYDIEDDDDDDDDDEGSTSEKSEESSDDDDIEQLLAPQEAMEEKL